MRLTFRHLAATVTAVVATVLAACQSSDLPISPNGPQGQSFSTNNALLRIVNGSPTAGSPCTVAGQSTVCIDIVIDGKRIPTPPGLPGFPYPVIPQLDSAAILPYVSVPSGPVLIQIFRSGTNIPVFEPTTPPLVLSANKKYSFVLAGTAPLPPPNPGFFQGYLFNDGLFNAGFGATMADFHNAAPSAGAQQFQVTCDSCVNPQLIGAPAGPGGIVGPVSLIPSSNYTVGTTVTQLVIAALNPLGNPGGVLPDPAGKQNVSVFIVDTNGAPPTFQPIAVEDTNG